MQGALTCIETKVLRIERNILQRIPPNTCKGVYGRGHLHPPRVEDDVQLRDAALKMAKDDSQDRETSSSHLLMPRFMKYLKHSLSKLYFNETDTQTYNPIQLPFIHESDEYVHVLANRFAHLDSEGNRVSWRLNCLKNSNSDRDVYLVCNGIP